VCRKLRLLILKLWAASSCVMWLALLLIVDLRSVIQLA
jgi:hypothetical protein